MSFSKKYLQECIKICNTLNSNEIEDMANLINATRNDSGRIFFLGVGGGDDGWETCYVNWLKGSNLSDKDLIFVFSVGGGNLEKNISVNILKSLQLAQDVGSKICGVVGRDGGYTKQVADVCIVVPNVNNQNVTPHTEAFQAIVWHLLVAHPLLLTNEMKWESTK